MSRAAAPPRRSFAQWIKLSIYAVSRALGLFALGRSLTRSRIRILGYHGASLEDEGAYNPWLFLSATVFRRRIEWLRQKCFRVITLDQALAIMEGAVAPVPRAVVLTFDDGWYSSARCLIPVLAEYGLPCTLYLSTNDFCRSGPVPAVTFGYMVWKCPRGQVDLQGLGADIDGSYLLADPARREAFLAAGLRWLEDPVADADEIRARLARLGTAMGFPHGDPGLGSRRFEYVTRDELRRLPDLGCRVELHGHHHRYPVGRPEVFAADLDACRAVIEQAGLPTPRHYCYPSGRFDASAEVVLEATHIRSATTCEPGMIDPGASVRRHYLPRFLDGGGIHALEFEAEISGFAGFLRRLRAWFAVPFQSGR